MRNSALLSRLLRSQARNKTFTEKKIVEYFQKLGLQPRKTSTALHLVVLRSAVATTPMADYKSFKSNQNPT